MSNEIKTGDTVAVTIGQFTGRKLVVGNVYDSGKRGLYVELNTEDGQSFVSDYWNKMSHMLEIAN